MAYSAASSSMVSVARRLHGFTYATGNIVAEAGSVAAELCEISDIMAAFANDCVAR